MKRLVLKRKVLESIVIDGPAKITVTKVKGHSATLSIEAEEEVKILRYEITKRATVHSDDPRGSENPGDRGESLHPNDD